MADEPQIDIEIPGEPRAASESVPNHDTEDSRARQRAAIAAARAIRRAAAAKERGEKKRAAEKAKQIVSPFRSPFRRKERRTGIRGGAPTGTTGILKWLESMRSAEDGETVPTPEANDSLVAQLEAEKHAQESAKASVDAIVAEITAEQSKNAELGESTVVTPALDEGADPQEIVDAIAAQLAPGIEPQEPPAAPDPAEPHIKPSLMTESGSSVVDRIIEQIAAENPPEPEEPRQSYVEAITAAREALQADEPEDDSQEEDVPAPSHDPLQRVYDAEITHKIEKQQAARHAREMEAAAEQFALDTAAAKPYVRRMKRKTDRMWQKEAAAEQARRYLPRTRRIAAVVNIGVCLLMFFGIAAGMLILERPTVSEIENRTLAKMPEVTWDNYVSGKLTNGTAEWYNDTVPFRELFKDMTAQMRQWMGLQSDGVIQNGVPVIDEEPEATTTTVSTEDPLAVLTDTRTTEAEVPDETTAPVQQEPENKDEGEMSKNILVVNKRGIPLFGGDYSCCRRYAGFLNKYQEQLGSGVQVWSMVVPTPCSFYTPEKFQKNIGSEEKNINHINEHLIGALPTDAYTPLQKHADEPIFMRTDHHWSALGAFYAAEEFTKTARVPFAKMSEYDKVVKENYVGTLYGFSGNIILKNNPEDFFYYVPHAEFDVTYYNRDLRNKRKGSLLLNLDHVRTVDWYMVYLGGDDRVTHIETGVKNGRKLAVIKDSYGNALIPWLTSSFEEITVIDMRYFTKNAISYLKEIGATDVLFAMNTFSAIGGNAKKIEQIRTQ